MNRRRFLKALPLTVCVAGCLGDSTTEQETAPVSVQLRSSYRYGVSTDGFGVKPPDNDQFAFVTPPDSAGDPAPGAYRLDLGNEQHSPVTSVPGFMSRTPSIEEVYTEGQQRGSLMFDIPTAETESAALRRDGTGYPLTEAARTRLATAPDFSLDSVSVPESVGPSENVAVAMTVTNDGDAAGTYLAGCRVGGLPREIDVPVEAGDAGSGSATFSSHPDSDSMYLNVAYPGGNREYEVTIEERRRVNSGPTAPNTFQ